MAERTMPFFKFDGDEWLTGKIQLLTAEEKGIFIDLIARIWKEKGKLQNDEILHRLIRVEKATLSKALKAFFEIGIMEDKDGFLSVKFIDEQLSERDEFIAKQSEIGRLGGRPKKGLKPKQKEESRKQKEDKEEVEEEKPGRFSLTEKEKELFETWIGVWNNQHSNGGTMPEATKGKQLELLLRIPQEYRIEALNAAIAGCWKHIHDPRMKLVGEQKPEPEKTDYVTLADGTKVRRSVL